MMVVRPPSNITAVVRAGFSLFPDLVWNTCDVEPSDPHSVDQGNIADSFSPFYRASKPRLKLGVVVSAGIDCLGKSRVGDI